MGSDFTREQQREHAPTVAAPEAAAPEAAAAAPSAMPALTVGSADDVAEHEADRMADAAVRKLDSLEPPKGELHRHAPGCGHDEPARRSAAPTGTAEVGLQGGAISPDLSGRISARRGQGAALDHGTKQRMESAFGRGFGGVRVHDNAEAHRLTSAVSAEAFTVGNDIFFNKGRFSPETPNGEHMLAHELGHVVQGGR